MLLSSQFMGFRDHLLHSGQSMGPSGSASLWGVRDHLNMCLSSQFMGFRDHLLHSGQSMGPSGSFEHVS